MAAIECYAMKSAPQTGAEMIAGYKAARRRLRPTPPPKIVEIAEPEQILAEPQRAEVNAVPDDALKTYIPKWSFIVHKGNLSFMSISETPAPTITHIKNVVAKKYGVSVIDMESERRTTNICWPRQVASYLCATMTRRSLPAIGKIFKRDHTTILNSRDKVARLILVNEDIEKEIFEMKQLILDTYREVAP